MSPPRPHLLPGPRRGPALLPARSAAPPPPALAHARPQLRPQAGAGSGGGRRRGRGTARRRRRRRTVAGRWGRAGHALSPSLPPSLRPRPAAQAARPGRAHRVVPAPAGLGPEPELFNGPQPFYPPRPGRPEGRQPVPCGPPAPAALPTRCPRSRCSLLPSGSGPFRVGAPPPALAGSPSPQAAGREPAP